jgi:hypothetical protein
MMTWALGHWTQLAEIVGTICEVYGVFLMGDVLLRVPATQVPRVMLSALIGGKAARSAATISEMVGHDDIVVSLRGLSLIALGLTAKALPSVADLFH